MEIKPVTLEGSHVRLEPLSEPEHLAAMCDACLDPEIWRWMPIQVIEPEAMKKFVAMQLRDQANGTALPFATVSLDAGRVIGGTRFMNIDVANRRVEIGGTWIAPPWQRTVVNTEAKYLMMRHAFEMLGCIRVELKTDSLNMKSRNAILRIGAKEEGILRNHMITWTGRLRHTVYFSVIEEEWPRVKKDLEEKLRQRS